MIGIKTTMIGIGIPLRLQKQLIDEGIKVCIQNSTIQMIGCILQTTANFNKLINNLITNNFDGTVIRY